MRLTRRRKQFIVGTVVSAAVFAAVWIMVGPDDADRVRGLAPAVTPAFDPGGELTPGPSRGVFSPDGTKLVALQNGRVDLALEGRFLPITPAGGNVVDVAWFGAGTVVLVAEGPAPTGGLAVVEIDGTVRGTIPLDPPVGFGTGYGMAVAPGDRRAVVTAVTREGLGTVHRHLALVDLETGKTRDLTEPGGTDEFDPHYLDDGRVLYTDGDRRSHVLDPGTGKSVPLALLPLAGVVDGRLAVAEAGGRLMAFAPGTEPGAGHDLGAIPDDEALVDIDPTGTRALVFGGTPGRLRTVRLTPPPPR